MRALSAAELLTVWERGATQSPAERALTLLVAARADTPLERLGQLSVGERDTKLIELRELVFGTELTSVVMCPKCSERLEFSVNTGEICLPITEEAAEPLKVWHSDLEALFRVPNSLDLDSLDPSADVETNRRLLLKQCVLDIQRAGNSMSVDELPPELIDAIEEQMAKSDPQADMRFALQCPRCRHSWQAPFDIVSYFWSEIHAWASRLLQEVHMLALNYGWREADILTLTPFRRHAYLRMIDQ
jgi:hypothetical protein